MYGPAERQHALARLAKAQQDLERVRSDLAGLRADLAEDDEEATHDARFAVRNSSVLIVQASDRLQWAVARLP